MTKEVPFPTTEQLKNAKVIEVATGETKSPPSNRSWVILWIGIGHITGTNSELRIYAHPTAIAAKGLLRAQIGSGAGSDVYSAFTQNATNQNSNISPFLVINDQGLIRFNGGTGSQANVLVVEI